MIYKLIRFLFRTIGRLSKGIDMSYRYGFTSGVMLDYIYENRAQGKLIIGKVFDRLFLSNVGWRAIRKRKLHLVEYLVDTIDKRKSKKVVLDMASGPARYLIEAVSITGEDNLKVICRDIDKKWLDMALKKAKEAGLENFTFEIGDAFDLKSLKKHKPNIVISSGFYDWLTDDNKVKKSMGYAYKILPRGGTFIFTNQAGHRALKFVSEVFVDFNDKPLKMTTRDPEQMENWARDIGFRKLETKLDRWGLYSVTRGYK